MHIFSRIYADSESNASEFSDDQQLHGNCNSNPPYVDGYETWRHVTILNMSIYKFIHDPLITNRTRNIF